MQYVKVYEPNRVGWTTVFSLLARYRWMILTVFIVTLLTGLGVLHIFFTDLYESQTAILVKIGRETTEVPATIVNGNVLSQGVRIQDINSEVQILSNLRLVEEAVEKIGLERYRNVLRPPATIWGYPKYWLKTAARFAKAQYKEVLYALSLKKRLTFREEVIVGVAGALKVEPVKESDVLVMKLRLPSAELAVETAREILSGYMLSRAEIRRNAAARNYYAEQARSYRGRVQDLEAERAKIREKWDVSSAVEQRTLLLKQLTDFETEREEYEGQIRKLEREQQEMSRKLALLPAKLTREETYTRNPILQSFRERITNLQMERAKLLGRYQPTAEVVTQIDGEIAALERSLKDESPTILASTVAESNPLRGEFIKGIEDRQVAIAGLRSRLTNLSDPIGKLRRKLDGLNLGSDAYDRVERDYRVAEQSYLDFHKRMSEARMSEELDLRDVSNVAIVSGPNLPIEPIYPRKLFIMGILLPAGLVLGIGMACLMESMNDRVRNEADLLMIEDVPYLGLIESSLVKRPAEDA